MIDLKKVHEQKGVIATVLLHIIVVLLMLIWKMSGSSKIVEDPIELQVEFEETPPPPPSSSGSSNPSEIEGGENGGGSAIPKPVDRSATKQGTKTSNNVKTQDNDKATETETSGKQDGTTKGDVNEAKRTVDEYFRKKKGSGSGTEENQPSGPRGTTIPGGNQGGKSVGGNDGFGYNLNGFGLGSFPSITNTTQETGSVVVKICVDRNMKIVKTQVIGGTSTSAELRRISLDAVKKATFVPAGEPSDENCGTITINYTLK
ncbi:MAG: hypothetical protein H6607_12925 [Flavobacteriales bacterium]|nr:hypothetical protein [Flavobacteriales bacterium]